MPHSILPPTPETLDTACQAWAAGRVVAFPTETVYGLGADIAQPEGVASIFKLKGRPPTHPLIVHIGDKAQLEGLSDSIAPPLCALAEAFWPGPLTIVVPKSQAVPESVTGGQNTVGIRMPGHPVALALLQAYGQPIAAPSANRYQHISPTTAAHVVSEFKHPTFENSHALAMVIEGGPCEVGLESTIVSWQSGNLVLLRPGHITPEQLEAVAGISVVEKVVSHVPRVPGGDVRHYAPQTPTYLGLNVPEQFSAGDCGVLLWAGEPSQHLPWLKMVADVEILPAEPQGYGRRLYAALRNLDEMPAVKVILIQSPPKLPAWYAVWDRLKRAAL